jgi:hypothetical protein
VQLFSHELNSPEYFTYQLVPVLALDYKQHILLLAKVIKVCYSLAELYVRCVLFEFIWAEGSQRSVWGPLV